MTGSRKKTVDGWKLHFDESIGMLRVFPPQERSMIQGKVFQDTENGVEKLEELNSQTDILEFVGDDVQYPKSTVDSWFDGEVPEEVKEHNLSKY
jgi:hypothetical protein